MRLAIQAGIGLIFLLFSTMASWYEGSALVDSPSEWKHSTPFTQIFKTSFSDGKDISQLDYFVYAAKFQPIFPVIMIVSILYLFILAGLYFLKNRGNLFSLYLFILGIICVLAGLQLAGSSTQGGRILFYVFAASGLVNLGFSFFKRIHQNPV
ncbi:YjdJ family protein [Bacillus sp. EB01]|uniref:YjdJ family protein n=1 Tax=Bacillus sp. EB01 TaxID=1347086 RepID=UPI0005C4E0D6|nr:YjdJ family protein [Bacillus sp. EB01]